MVRRGYCVVPELYDELCAELEQLSIQHRRVDKPNQLGTNPTPVLVTKGPCPKGWSRYRKCTQGKHGRGLTENGNPSDTCSKCMKPLTSEELWRRIEISSPAEELRLPGWFQKPTQNNVREVRHDLNKNNLRNVGPERRLIVAEALVDWRERMRNAIAGSDADIWKRIEKNSPIKELSISKWPTYIVTISGMRHILQENTSQKLWLEENKTVEEALEEWRKRVQEILLDS